MANEYAVNQADLAAVADAIREKGGTSDALEFPGGFVEAVGAIQTGSGGLDCDIGEFVVDEDAINFTVPTTKKRSKFAIWSEDAASEASSGTRLPNVMAFVAENVGRLEGYIVGSGSKAGGFGNVFDKVYNGVTFNNANIKGRLRFSGANQCFCAGCIYNWIAW